MKNMLEIWYENQENREYAEEFFRKEKIAKDKAIKEAEFDNSYYDYSLKNHTDVDESLKQLEDDLLGEY